MLRPLFSFALFLSAALVFWVQPMFGKMVLPLLGGAPAVWNTCMVFFQAALLAGYLYAHVQSRILTLRGRIVLHLCLLTVCICFLPIAVPVGWSPPTDANPMPWLLTLLSLAVSGPFVLLSASAPLLQNWFSRSGERYADDPYFLYVASNVGSLVGLLGYPVIVEPYLTLKEQTWCWAVGYVGLLACFVISAMKLWRIEERRSTTEVVEKPQAPSWMLRLKWLALAAVPSSLFQGVTTHITTDVAAVPLLWVIPLAIYLSSFVLVFSRRTWLPHGLMLRLHAIALPLLIVIIYWLRVWHVWVLFPLHLMVLFLTAMVCHGELKQSRPNPLFLTEFYLWMSIGGVLGGVFNAIVAPLVFNTIVEYPLALIAAAFLRPVRVKVAVTGQDRVLDLAIPAVLAVFLVGIIWLMEIKLSLPVGFTEYMVLAGVATLVVIACGRRPLRFGLGVAVLLLSGLYVKSVTEVAQWQPLYAGRSFFGTVKVESNPQQGLMRLVHGHVLHGQQSYRAELSRQPMTYFHRSGPLGNVFACIAKDPHGKNVGIVGLGAGAIAGYAHPQDRWLFYEIDPLVRDVAVDPRYFTFISGCPAKTEVFMGDGRLSLKKTPDAFFDLLVLDAFSSDAIPVHLITKDAVELYVTKLKPHGLLAFNITNNYVKMENVIQDIALSAGLSGMTKHWDLDDISERDISSGATPSTWAVLSRDAKDLSGLTSFRGWKAFSATADAGIKPWTDEYSNIFKCLWLPWTPRRR